jgi:hypothetical protein
MVLWKKVRVSAIGIMKELSEAAASFDDESGDERAGMDRMARPIIAIINFDSVLGS